MIAELPYCAALVYSPRGQSQVSRDSRRYRDALKRANPVFLDQATAHVARQVAAGQFRGFFGGDVTLVPVPGSAPRRDASTLWVAERLAEDLRSKGMGAGVWTPLRRVAAVPKSAYAAPGDRPTAERHVASLALADMLAPTRRILLVDDIVTKGATLLAAATVLSNAIQGLDMRAFALIRTMGLQPEVASIVAPAVGTIRWAGEAIRDP